MKLGLILIALLVSLDAFSADQIVVAAGAAPLDNVFSKVEGPFTKATGIKLVLNKKTHVTALEDLSAGKADVASTAFTFEDWIGRASKDGYTLPNKDDYKFKVIGKDVLIIAVNKANKVAKLNKEEIKKIFAGQVKNWSEVGGDVGEIKVLLADKLPGINDFFKGRMLKDVDFGVKPNVKGSTAELKAEIEKTKNAVAFLPHGNIDSSFKVVQTDEISRPVTVATKGEPNDKVKKLLEYISGEGKQYIVR